MQWYGELQLFLVTAITHRLPVAREMAVLVEFGLQVVIITVPRDELHLLGRLPMALPLINKPVVDLLLIEARRLR